MSAAMIRVPTAKAPAARRSVVVRAAAQSGTGNPVPDMNKRNILNGVLLASAGLPSTAMIAGFLAFLVPPSTGSGAGGLPALDAAGTEVKESQYLETHPAGDVNLVQGLKGDPTYLIVKNDGKLETFGLNAVCTHLGCVVPWVPAENKFKCPCHGSQYNNQGKVVRGPAPLSLALAHIEVNDDVVTLVPWTETDFRTGLSPWWA